MTQILRSSRLAIGMLIAVMLLSTACTTSNQSFLNNASLAQENPAIAYLNITQFGLPGDEQYVFCDERDCPSRTIKHRYRAEVAKFSLLVMPEPIQK
jgi:hypothetical protein